MVAKRHQDKLVTHHGMRHNVPYCLCYFSQRLVHPLLPYGIMGINALLAGLLCMTLPETKGMPTAETVDSEEGAEEAYVALQVGILLCSMKGDAYYLLVSVVMRVSCAYQQIFFARPYVLVHLFVAILIDVIL